MSFTINDFISDFSGFVWSLPALFVFAFGAALLLRLSCVSVSRMSSPSRPPTQNTTPATTVEFTTDNTGPYAPPTTFEQSAHLQNRIVDVPMPTYGRAIVIAFLIHIVAVADLNVVARLVNAAENGRAAIRSGVLIALVLVVGVASASLIVAWILPTSYPRAFGVTLRFIVMYLVTAGAIVIWGAIVAGMFGVRFSGIQFSR